MKNETLEQLKRRVMRTEDFNQPLTTQARFICKEIQHLVAAGRTPKSRGLFASRAIDEQRELEYVLDMAFQILDHRRAQAEHYRQKAGGGTLTYQGYILFNFQLDQWILEIHRYHEDGKINPEN